MVMPAAGRPPVSPRRAGKAFIHYSLADQNIYRTFMRAGVASPVETAVGNGQK
jgi:hypothetical protein